jgi:hypothetical protein
LLTDWLGLSLSLTSGLFLIGLSHCGYQGGFVVVNNRLPCGLSR